MARSRDRPQGGAAAGGAITDKMMGPQVVLMPRLAEVPKPLLANLCVFTNGIEGGGPFGFQPDVFDAVPEDEGYSPLRAINLVAWEEGATARELRSVEEVKAAESKGEVTIKRPGIVVNMPVLLTPGTGTAVSASVRCCPSAGASPKRLTDAQQFGTIRSV